MSIPDDWQPPPCKHGAPPIVEQDFMDWSYGLYTGMMPTRKALTYDCPTPMECSKEQRELASQAYDEAPP